MLWAATKLHNSKSFWSICMKISGIMCPVMKNICGKFHCQQTSMRKVIALVFIYAYLACSIKWRIYASFRTVCIWMHDAYMRHWRYMCQSALKVLRVWTRVAESESQGVSGFWVESVSDFFVWLWLRKSNWIIFYVTLQNWEFLLKWHNFLWSFVETYFLLFTTISIDFNSQISFPLC